MRRPIFVLLAVPLLAALDLLPAQTIASLVETLAKAESLDDEAIGIGGTKSETFKAYELLRERAKKEELLGLLDHDAAVVRGYAFRALVDRKEAVNWPALLQARAQDKAKIATFQGCVRSEQMLGDVVIAWAREHKLLTEEQWLAFYEHLVTAKSSLCAREQVLRTMRFRDGMVDAIRALARAGDGAALVALARYKQAKDLSLLATSLSRSGVFDDTNAFLAAQMNPDASLLPALVELESKARAKITEGLVPSVHEWLAAIAAQRSPAAGQFLARFLAETPADVHERELVQAIKGVLVPFGGDAVFADVREELKRRAKR